MSFTRPTWDEYFMTIAELTSQRSNCIKRRVGSLVVKNNRILSLGYNGTPRGTVNCFEGGCPRCSNQSQPGTNLDLCMCIHAEENALLFLSATELENSTLYVTLMPCIGCAKKIIQCRISRILYKDNYQEDLDHFSKSILEKHGIMVEKYGAII